MGKPRTRWPTNKLLIHNALASFHVVVTEKLRLTLVSCRFACSASLKLRAAFQNRQCFLVASRMGIVDKGDQQIGEHGIVPQFQGGRLDPSSKIIVEIAACGVVGFGPAGT